MTLPLSVDPAFSRLLLDSHARFVGMPLCSRQWPSDAAAAGWLYEQAPFALLAHDTASDPLFIYANQTAQRCFEYGWEEFVGLPSRLSAEPGTPQEERAALLRSVAEHRYATGYCGVRISKSGSRFWIEDGTVWDLVDADGVQHGQAAVFHTWSDA